MGLRRTWLVIFIFCGMYVGCENSKESQSRQNLIPNYDMREDLTPTRLTIAMWDFSWMYMHYPGGAFENFDRVTDELLERGFNTVRIDAFPLIIGKLDSLNQEVTIAGGPLRNWGPSDKDRQHDVVNELTEFMKMTKEKGLYVILSSWGFGCLEFPEILNDYKNRNFFWQAWEKTLNILKDEKLLDHVLYVDFDQEFPYFSPFNAHLNNLQKTLVNSEKSKMEAAGHVELNFEKYSWNNAQMNFVHDYFSSTLSHFQRLYPHLRFTFSLTSYWKEVRLMNIQSLDVLELHMWMSQSAIFQNRSGFSDVQKDRGDHNFKDYQNRVNALLLSSRPKLLKEMFNRMDYAQKWSEEIAAPLVTTESWGPWWNMDHNDLDWQWLQDWCELCMNMAPQYGFWGVTPWNYSHPYWDNWQNVEWYNKVNKSFLNAD